MFFPHNKKDSHNKTQIAHALCSVAESHGGKFIIKEIEKERENLHRQMESAPTDLFPMMQGKCQAYTEILKAFEVAEEIRRNA